MSKPTTECSDDELMVGVAAGSQDAFAILVDRHQQSIRQYCSCFLGNSELARDVAQDVFLQLWSVRRRYQPQGSFKAFVFTIARNKCRSLQRRNKLLHFIGLSPSVPGGDDQLIAVDEQFARNETMQMLMGALQQLPPKFRMPLLMRFSEGMGYDEIAQVINRTPSTARSRIHYGLKRLASLLPREVGP